MVKRPWPMPPPPGQHLCADNGYDSATFRVAVRTDARFWDRLLLHLISISLVFTTACGPTSR